MISTVNTVFVSHFANGIFILIFGFIKYKYIVNISGQVKHRLIHVYEMYAPYDAIFQMPRNNGGQKYRLAESWRVAMEQRRLPFSAFTSLKPLQEEEKR